MPRSHPRTRRHSMLIVATTVLASAAGLAQAPMSFAIEDKDQSMLVEIEVLPELDAPDGGEPEATPAPPVLPEELPTRPSPPPSSGPAACAEAALRQFNLSETQVLQLCTGAQTGAPVDCYRRARDQTFLPEEQAVSLCTCATSPGPVECFAQGRRNTFLDEYQLLSLCTPPASTLYACQMLLPRRF